MNQNEKKQAALQLIKSLGLKGILNIAATKIRCTLINQSPTGEDLLTEKPIFRFAACDDLFQLMAAQPGYCRFDRDSDRSPAYGLKSMGTIFCANKISHLKPQRLLEIGAGWNCDFDTHFGAASEYWMIDDASEIGGDRASMDKFERSVQNRKNTHFVRGLVGSFLPELQDNYFDVVFSVSVIEHIPYIGKKDFYEDMFRIVKPGGWIVHSIDLWNENLALVEFELLRQTGFKLPRTPDLRIRVRSRQGRPTLFEDLWTVFHGYMGLNRQDKWEKVKQISRHYPTILVCAQKPMHK